MSTSASAPRLGAVILTGGRGVRLGGVDKASIEVGGATLLERAITATVSAQEVVVVGEQVLTSRPVTWTRESPAGGGPAAGLLAGLDVFLVPPDLVCVLAVDMPQVTPSTVARLVDALAGQPRADGAVIVDASGRLQTLAAVYRYDALVAARPDDPAREHGMSIRKLVGSLEVVGVAAVGDEAHDIDTWEDLRSFGE